jgi:hypothetical protein
MAKCRHRFSAREWRGFRAGHKPEGESRTNAGRVGGIIAAVLHIVGLLVGAAIFACR